jgi:lipid-binding SYLF domain-containing protein
MLGSRSRKGAHFRKQNLVEKENAMNTKAMRTLMAAATVVLVAGFLACAGAPPSKSQIDEQRASVRAMASQTLAQLYKENPAARDVVASSAGYAVFSDFGMKVMFFGGAKGSGVAINTPTKQETFMKMAELQPGLGLGAEKFRVVFIFEEPAAFNSFVTSGWELGANAMAAAKTKTTGGGAAGAMTVSKGVKMYQLNEEGLIVGVSITGAKYYKDKELN